MCPRNPSKYLQRIKPHQGFWDAIRRFLAKNRDILNALIFLLTFLGVLIAAATLAFAVYSHFSSIQTKPQNKPDPRLEIEQPVSTIPVQFVNREDTSKVPA